MHKVFQLPSSTRRRLITPSLALLVLFPSQEKKKARELEKAKDRIGQTPHLDAALLSRRRLKVSFPDPLRDLIPQRAALPLSLSLHRLHRDLFLRTSHIRERRARLRVLACRIPLPLKSARLRAGARADGWCECRLERV